MNGKEVNLGVTLFANFLFDKNFHCKLLAEINFNDKFAIFFVWKIFAKLYVKNEKIINFENLSRPEHFQFFNYFQGQTVVGKLENSRPWKFLKRKIFSLKEINWIWETHNFTKLDRFDNLHHSTKNIFQTPMISTNIWKAFVYFQFQSLEVENLFKSFQASEKKM